MLEGRYIHIPRQKAQITLQTSLPPTFRNEVEERKERAERERGQDERDCWCRTKCKKGKEKREKTETERRNEKGDEKRTRKTRCKQEVEMNSARIFFSYSRSITNVADTFVFPIPGKICEAIRPCILCQSLNIAMEFADRARSQPEI